MKAFFSILMVFAISHLGFTQVEINENSTYYDYLQYYYDPSRYTPSEEYQESGANEQVKRFNKTWGERLYPHGDGRVASNGFYDYFVAWSNNYYNTRTLQGAFTDVLSDNTFESIDNTGFRG